LSVKVIKIFLNIFFQFFFILFYYYLQGIISECPTGEQFLNQHGKIGLFADGFTSLERKYLKFLIIRMSGEEKDVQNIDMKKILKKDLHKVCNSQIIMIYTRNVPFRNTNVLHLLTSNHHEDLVCQGTRDKVFARFTGLDTILRKPLSEGLRDSVSC
jgi:hypothetical protein